MQQSTKKKLYYLVLLVNICAISLLFGCDEFEGLKKPKLHETLLIAGSSTWQPTVDQLSGAYKKHNPQVVVINEDGGSTAGLLALRKGVIDMATLSRGIKSHEDKEGIACFTIARTAIGIVVHPKNPISNINPQQIYGIFTGSINNWDTLGGMSAPIHVLSYTESSTTRRGMNDLILYGTDFVDAIPEFTSATELVATVSEDVHAIGYVSMADLSHISEKLQASVKLLPVNNVPLTKNTILSFRYPLSRVFHCAVRIPISPNVAKFLDFMQSTEGKKIMQEIGLITVD